MVDLSFLKKFAKGDETKIRRYINMYLHMAPETFNQMQQHLNDKNWTQLAISAHSLKPQTDYMGIAELKATLIKIEDRVRQEQYDDISVLFAKARTLHEESAKVLRAQL